MAKYYHIHLYLSNSNILSSSYLPKQKINSPSCHKLWWMRFTSFYHDVISEAKQPKICSVQIIIYHIYKKKPTYYVL